MVVYNLGVFWARQHFNMSNVKFPKAPKSCTKHFVWNLHLCIHYCFGEIGLLLINKTCSSRLLQFFSVEKESKGQVVVTSVLLLSVFGLYKTAEKRQTEEKMLRDHNTWKQSTSFILPSFTAWLEKNFTLVGCAEPLLKAPKGTDKECFWNCWSLLLSSLGVSQVFTSFFLFF